MVEGVAATLGNSPTEYRTMRLQGARIAYSTTNGTRAILEARNCERLYVGAFANLTALCHRLIEDGVERLAVLCSGWQGDACIEDTLMAGALCQRLQATPLNDAAIYAPRLYEMASERGLYDYCVEATHVQRLLRLGYAADVRFSMREDTCNVVPMLHGERLLLS